VSADHQFVCRTDGVVNTDHASEGYYLVRRDCLISDRQCDQRGLVPCAGKFNEGGPQRVDKIASGAVSELKDTTSEDPPGVALVNHRELFERMKTSQHRLAACSEITSQASGRRNRDIGKTLQDSEGEADGFGRFCHTSIVERASGNNNMPSDYRTLCTQKVRRPGVVPRRSGGNYSAALPVKAVTDSGH
jgi:hypothetical protein